MPRRQFLADLDKAKKDILPLGITNVKAGDDDGQLEFSFVGGPDGLQTGPVSITAMVPVVDDYPKSHEYMIFVGEDASAGIADAVNNIRGVNRKTVFELLDIVSTTLLRISPDRDGDSQMQEEDDYAEEDDDDVDIYGSDHEDFEPIAPRHTAAFATSAPSSVPKSRTTDRNFRQRIRHDLRAAKEAGFKVGVLGHLLDGQNCYVTLSVRIAKLGISEEAMQAWQVEPSDYLTLIIQFPNGYKTNEELQGYDSIRLTPNLAMRVVAGERYKPTLQEAIKAFTVARKGDRYSSNDLPAADEADADDSSIRETFISKPLVNLLETRLVPILRNRTAGLGWKGAEDFYRHQTTKGAAASDADVIPDEFFMPEALNEALPQIVQGDHYQKPGTKSFSFPLLAMQFLLRHFVRCTDFCLVCHRKLDTEVEAIKPYVCDDSLCLYQYMTLGFGPSIEYELLAQPYVVDLLISFCYNSCAARKLKDYPDGLSLTVPPIDIDAYHVIDPYGGRYGMPPTSPTATTTSAAKAKKYDVGFDIARREIIFYDPSAGCPVRRGAWIVLTAESIDGYDLHCRVRETAYFPTIEIDTPVKIRQQTKLTAGQVVPAQNGTQTPAATRPVSPATGAPNFAKASFQIYDQDFVGLDSQGKCLAMCRLLDTLPSVFEMRDWLSQHRPSELKNWLERISPAALTLLRWIIASNRACIMQVDGEKQSEEDVKAVKSSSKVFNKPQERCFGMSGYMQFRFAMGAPDKEQRFISEVRKTTARLNLKHPTIFAWHGSPLYNWHMIIREGLHYKNTDHGRAYGHGVYHAKDAGTSTGYSGMGYYPPGSGGPRSGTWPQSVLRANTALALNEIVNAPPEFVSSNPYYVVQHLDWIQTRYLFVQVAPINDKVQIGEEVKPKNPHPQDPHLTPKGIGGEVVIPASAIKSSKTARDGGVTQQAPAKKLKLLSGKSASNPVVIDDDEDAASETTDVEDLEILFDEPEPEPVKVMSVVAKPQGPKTDFVPGSLDFSTLPLMPLPTYATSGTTRHLMKELQSLSKVQEATNPAELGWYIDVEKIENVYQWIVELHSFHTFEVNGKPLPLAEDMKRQKVKSIVLEICFNKDFPFTPPYVRVVRPQFLTFNEGGGGHIVQGGAMCMELLTNTGWTSVSSMEGVLMQIRMAIASEPFARLQKSTRGDYGTGDAAAGYIRACHTHGWQVPPGFHAMAYGKEGVGKSNRS